MRPSLADDIWKTCAIMFGVCALVGVLTSCANRYEAAQLACQSANAVVAIAQAKLDLDPDNSGLRLRLIGYKAAAKTACDYAASLEPPATVTATARSAVPPAAYTACVAEAAEQPEDTWADAAEVCARLL